MNIFVMSMDLASEKQAHVDGVRMNRQQFLIDLLIEMMESLDNGGSTGVL